MYIDKRNFMLDTMHINKYNVSCKEIGFTRESLERR